MDQLKKNGFVISLSVLGLGAIALFYFLVLGKVTGESGLSGVEKRLGDLQKRKYEKYASSTRTPIIPSEKNAKLLQDTAEKWDKTLQDGRTVYEGWREKFNQPHSEDLSVDDASSFKAFYETNVDKLRDEYRKKFMAAAVMPGEPGEPAAPGGEPAAAGADPAAATAPLAAQPAAKERERLGVPAGPEPPVIDKFTSISTPEDIARARKEFRILEELFAALTELNLGGLQDVRFFGRPGAPGGGGAAAKAAAQAAPAEYRWIITKVRIEMPLPQLEPLLARLFKSERVPFRLESLSMERIPNTHVTKIVDTKDYRSAVEADQESPDAVRHEPPVAVELDLAALEYLGAPPEAAK